MSESGQTLMFGESAGSKNPASDASPTSDQGGQVSSTRPLAVRMRPRALEEILGQDRILGADSLLPGLIRSDRFGNIILYGPPGCGKTSLAEVIAEETGNRFVRLNAVMSNVAELRDILRFARSRPEDRVILFIDEIHRFNRAQQDLLLPDVEAGNVRLIGATTHNPGFSVISPLLSRSHLLRLEPLDEDVVATVLAEALKDKERGLGEERCTADDGVLVSLARFSDGDLRRALSALETIVAGVAPGTRLTGDTVARFARERQIRYDANEDEHYDTASAFIKSMRGGDPDSALYWLAKMLEGGEDPRFIARRLVILASEDIGLADPAALPLAVAAFQACELIGLPECEYNLAHATVYLAVAPKSNSANTGLKAARRAVRDGPVQPVPLHLRDGSTKTNRNLGHGADYLYSHDFPEAITGQNYMEDPQVFYRPLDSGAENAIAERLQRWRSMKNALRVGRNL